MTMVTAIADFAGQTSTTMPKMSDVIPLDEDDCSEALEDAEL